MPTSYQAPMRGDTESKERTTSQSVTSNASSEHATVQKLLQGKGGDAFTISPGETISSAVGILRDKRIGALIVVDENGDLAGILSERDIVRKLADTPGKTLAQKVEDNMTRKVVTCTPEDPLITVLRRMTEGRFRHMPVLDDGKLCGIVTIGDVVKFRLNELEHEVLQLKQMIVG
ncbi:MAG: CBS domain-containing protein [Pseudomonadota bacterium]